jgi:hypothetical protein
MTRQISRVAGLELAKLDRASICTADDDVYHVFLRHAPFWKRCLHHLWILKPC